MAILKTRDREKLVGAVVAAARSKDKMGLRQLARNASVSPSYLTRIEAGEVRASEDILDRLADELGRSPIMLAGLAGYVHLADAVSSAELAPRLLADWSSEQQAALDAGEPAAMAEFLALAFVELRRIDVLEGTGLSDRHYPGLTRDRARAVEAFEAEQRVLSDLDRRGSNPATMRLAGRLADDEDEQRYHEILRRAFADSPDEVAT